MEDNQLLLFFNDNWKRVKSRLLTFEITVTQQQQIVLKLGISQYNEYQKLYDLKYNIVMLCYISNHGLSWFPLIFLIVDDITTG